MNTKTMTHLLHAVLIVGVLLLAALFFWAVPQWGLYMARVEAPEFASAFWPCLIWAWVFALPIFGAVLPAWRVVSSISSADGAFTRANSRDLRRIACLAFADALVFPLGMLIVALRWGAGSPGLTVLVTPAVMFVCAAAGVAALCLGRLVGDAAALREENDLTI